MATSAQQPEIPLLGFYNSRPVTEFQKLCKVGEGTYGAVYRARDKRTNEIVALKKLHLNKEKFPITSVREINILRRLRHPHIVQLKEVSVGQKPTSVFLVFEFCDHDFSTLLDSPNTGKRRFSEGEAKTLMLQVLSAVDYLHSNFIMHRDLKMSNLLINRHGHVKLADFGLARQFSNPLLPCTPKVVTIWYRAPELLLGVTTALADDKPQQQQQQSQQLQPLVPPPVVGSQHHHQPQRMQPHSVFSSAATAGLDPANTTVSAAGCGGGAPQLLPNLFVDTAAAVASAAAAIEAEGGIDPKQQQQFQQLHLQQQQQEGEAVGRPPRIDAGGVPGGALYHAAIDMWAIGCILGELLQERPLLPGRTEMDQLERIYRLLGSPSERIWPGLTRLLELSPIDTSKLPHFPYNQLSRVFPELGEAGVDLLNRLLTFDPSKRISAARALSHPWFAAAPLPVPLELMPTFPSRWPEPPPLPPEERLPPLDAAALAPGGMGSGSGYGAGSEAPSRKRRRSGDSISPNAPLVAAALDSAESGSGRSAGAGSVDNNGKLRSSSKSKKPAVVVVNLSAPPPVGGASNNFFSLAAGGHGNGFGTSVPSTSRAGAPFQSSKRQKMAAHSPLDGVFGRSINSQSPPGGSSSGKR